MWMYNLYAFIESDTPLMGVDKSIIYNGRLGLSFEKFGVFYFFA